MQADDALCCKSGADFLGRYFRHYPTSILTRVRVCVRDGEREPSNLMGGVLLHCCLPSRSRVPRHTPHTCVLSLSPSLSLSLSRGGRVASYLNLCRLTTLRGCNAIPDVIDDCHIDTCV